MPQALPKLARCGLQLSVYTRPGLSPPVPYFAICPHRHQQDRETIGAIPVSLISTPVPRTVTIKSLPEAFAVIKEITAQDYDWSEDY